MFTKQQVIDFATWLHSYPYDEYNNGKCYYNINGQLYTPEEAFELWYGVSGVKLEVAQTEVNETIPEEYKGWRINYTQLGDRHLFEATKDNQFEEVDSQDKKDGLEYLLKRLDNR